MQETVKSAGLDRALTADIRAKLTGMPIARIVRSHGSMFMVKLGSLRETKGLRRPIQRGEWELLVEAADWGLSLPSGRRIASSDPYGLIDDEFASVKNAPVRDFEISPQGIIRLTTAMGHILEVTEPNAELGKLKTLSRWVLYHNDRWLLSCGFDGSFEYQDSSE